jgi:hypothetical protein
MKVGSWNFTSMSLGVREDGKIWLSIETPWTHESRLVEFYLCESTNMDKMAKY